MKQFLLGIERVVPGQRVRRSEFYWPVSVLILFCSRMGALRFGSAAVEFPAASGVRTPPFVGAY